MIMAKWIAVLACGVLLVQCGKAEHAGGTGTETTNGLEIVAELPSGTPAAGLLARVRPANYISDSAVDPAMRTDVQLNAQGIAVLPNLPRGTYSIEITDSNLYATLLRVEHNNVSQVRTKVPLGIRTRMVVQRGSMPQGFVPWLQFRGLERRVRVDADTIDLPLLPATELTPHLAYEGLGGFGENLAPLQVQDSVVLSLTLPRETWDVWNDAWQFVRNLVVAEDSLRSVRRIEVFQNRIIGLHLDSLNLDSLPQQLYAQDYVEYLDLSFNQLPYMPPQLFDSMELYHLFLDGNPIDSLPIELLNNGKLRHLSIGYMPSMALPQSLSFPLLEGLYLPANELLQVPTWIYGLGSSLTNLDLQGNKLQTISDSIQLLNGLVFLSLESNELQSLPALNGMDQLRVLSAGDNQLTQLPQGLQHLPDLQQVYVGRNRLTNLPAEIEYSKLRTIDLIGNHICESLPKAQESWLDSLVGKPWRSVQPQNCP